MKRVLTALVGIPLAMAAVFYLPRPGFFLLLLVLAEILAWELAQLAERRAPGGPHWVLMLLVPLAAILMTRVPRHGELESGALASVIAVPLLLSLVVGAIVVVSRVPIVHAAEALGLLSFGTAYLAVPVVSLAYLRSVDPWLVVLLVAVVWCGDTAAFYCGRAFGRRKLAPVISPNKTWEGAVAGFLAGLAAAAVWSVGRFESIGWEPLVVAAVIAIAAQVGDLVESVLKRSAGIKDSGRLLPGHGGLLDRMDALLFAAPTLAAILLLAGEGVLSGGP